MKLAGQNVVVRYGTHNVLDGLDIACDGGELVGLIGPNGAGKTTLLRVLAGLQKPHAGNVTYDTRAVADIAPTDFAGMVAYLEQGGAVHWPMRAEAVVALGRLPHRSAAADDEAAIARAMLATHVISLRDRAMNTLSGGEAMRVLLARALAVESALLLADEPVAALDPLHQLRVMELLQSTVRRGTGVVTVLHDLSLAARFCDRLVLIARGVVVAQGLPGEVLQPMHLKRAYGVEMILGMADGIPFVLPRAPA